MLPSAEDIIINELRFENCPQEVTQDVQLKNILLELEKTVKELEQKKFIKEIVSILLPLLTQ